MTKKRVRCNIKGCTKYSYRGDCRCLDHIRLKYGDIWSYNITGFSSETGYRKPKLTIDRYEQ